MVIDERVMRMVVLIIIITIIQFSTLLSQEDHKPLWGNASHSASTVHQSGEIDIAQRDKWIKMVADSLLSLPPEHFEQIEGYQIELPEYTKSAYRIYLSGEIRFSNHDRVYVILHSAHDDSKIGDISVAVNQIGEIYINTGHVCGGMVHFVRYTDQFPKNGEEFFSSFVTDTDEVSWVKWNH